MSAVSLRDKSLALRHEASGALVLVTDLARRLDPSELCAAIGMVPDPWQLEVLQSGRDRILLNCHRQSGKSTVASILGVHGAVYESDSLTLIFSPSMRQSGEVFRKCLAVYQSIGRPVVAEAENALSLILENGSRIISLPGSEATVRGYSGVRRVIVDEAAAVKGDLIAAVRPMLAVSNGDLIAMSTPRGKQGWFWEAWVTGRGWMRIQVKATECSRISADFLEEERLALGERLFAQEYMCEFVEVTDQAFGEEAVAAAFDRSLQPIELSPEDPGIDLDAKVS